MVTRGRKGLEEVGWRLSGEDCTSGDPKSKIGIMKGAQRKRKKGGKQFWHVPVQKNNNVRPCGGTLKKINNKYNNFQLIDRNTLHVILKRFDIDKFIYL
ncbi:hypothetical protein HYC85_004794 [Camellia sinensis]|uniref:Uncharacterized protein n=1 Tax=Camellia sinensis TaxID=4442 RepID=A0A7J7HY42_CAMSI|nr:hypothetical protein HYC85_004794 [Camellia sinensis]